MSENKDNRLTDNSVKQKRCGFPKNTIVNKPIILPQRFPFDTHFGKVIIDFIAVPNNFLFLAIRRHKILLFTMLKKLNSLFLPIIAHKKKNFNKQINEIDIKTDNIALRKRHFVQNFRSRERYCIASAIWVASMISELSKSATVLATLKILS